MATSRKSKAREGDFPPSQACYDLTINVLGFREGDEWAAVALDMDLWGHGGKFEEAVEDLWDLVRMQIRFAQSKGRPEMIWKSAEPVWFQRFADVRRERMEALIRAQSPREDDYEIAGLPLPPLEVIEGPSFELLPAEA